MGGQFTEVKVSSKKEGLSIIRKFLNESISRSQAFLMADGRLTANNYQPKDTIQYIGASIPLFVRMNEHQPCQGGEMRTYKSSHGADCTRPEDGRPNDLYCPFPEGTPLVVGVPWQHVPWQHIYEPFDPVKDIIFNPEISPWRSVLKKFELTEKYSLILDTDVDSTTLVSLFRFMNSEWGSCGRTFNRMKEMYPNEDPLTLFIASVQSSLSYENEFVPKAASNYYTAFSGSPDYRRIYNGTPIDLTGGTFKGRFAYNRPQIDYLFGQGVHKLTGIKPSPNPIHIINKIKNFIEG